MAINAINTISEKVHDNALQQELSKQKLWYSVIQNKATDRLQNERAEEYHASAMQDLMLKGGIQMNTFTNCSTSKIAELMIQGSNRGITSMWKSMNHHQNSGNLSMEVAKELVDFEQKSIARLKKIFIKGVTMTRLNKYLAECGLCSRREADKLIDQGRVYVNGQRAVSGMKVCDRDIVEVNHQRLQSAAASKVVLAYNKPVGITCTEKDRYAEKTIVEAVNYPVRLTYAGRLDKASDGLIILTNDGELIQRMMKGANGHEKEYLVKVDRELTEEFLTKMAQGVYLRELDATTRPCTLKRIGKYTFQITLTQGLNRQIRRMCGCFGYNVKSLTRIRVMNIELNGLKSGEYREIKGQERETLYRLCGISDSQ